MIKQLKHYISILLILGLTTSGYSGNGQQQLASAPLFSEVTRRSETHHTTSNLYVYGTKSLDFRALWSIFVRFVSPKKLHSAQTITTFKNQIDLFKAIYLDKLLQAFLPKVSTHRTPFSSLYIA